MQGGPGRSGAHNPAPEPHKPPPSESHDTPPRGAHDSEAPAPAPTPAGTAPVPGEGAAVPAYALHSKPAEAEPTAPPAAGRRGGPHGVGPKPRRGKGKAKNSGVSTSMQALLGLLSLSGVLTVVVAAIAVLLIQRRRSGKRGTAVRGDSVVFAVRRPTSVNTASFISNSSPIYFCSRICGISRCLDLARLVSNKQ